MNNPFKILNISPDSDKKQIIQAAALAMQEKKYSGQEIAMAQKMLLDPVQNQVFKFIYCFDFENLKQEVSFDKQQEQLAEPLNRLSLFDDQ